MVPDRTGEGRPGSKGTSDETKELRLVLCSRHGRSGNDDHEQTASQGDQFKKQIPSCSVQMPQPNHRSDDLP
jgi:hypothetical protein